MRRSPANFSGLARTLALAVCLIGILAVGAVIRAGGQPNAETSAAEWCLSDGMHTQQAAQAGRLWLGMRWYSEDDRESLVSDPRWPTACAVAHQLWGLTGDEWAWCWDPANRESALAPAISFLGLGRDEAQGTETFLEAPGDDPAEYTQACRFAFRFWRTSPVGTNPGPEFAPFLAVAPQEAEYCGDHPSRVTQAQQLLQIDTPVAGDSIPSQLAFARACSFAATVAAVDDLPLAMPPPPTPSPAAGDDFRLEVLSVNHSNVESSPKPLMLNKSRAWSFPHVGRCASMARLGPTRGTSPTRLPPCPRPQSPWCSSGVGT